MCGTLFAGYLTFFKLFAKSCAFNEPCPYFLGYPACWYGLAMFGAMLIGTLFGLSGKLAVDAAARTNAVISSLGVLFSGYMTWTEVASWAVGAPKYGLGLPTCAYGLMFYAALLALSLKALRRGRRRHHWNSL